MKALFLPLIAFAVLLANAGCRELLKRDAYIEQAEQNALTENCGIRYFRYEVPSLYQQGDGAPDVIRFDGGETRTDKKVECLRASLKKPQFKFAHVEVQPDFRTGDVKK